MSRSLIVMLAGVLILSTASVRSQSLTPDDSVPDQSVTKQTRTFGRSFWFDGDRANGGPTEFRWITSTPRSFVQEANGNARLLGSLENVARSDHRLDVDISISGFVPPGAPAPAGSPKLTDLKTSALRSNGGPIDPNGWAYYERFTGTLKGTDALSGWVLEIGRMGPALQLGFGASSENAEYGMSNWFTITVKSRGANNWHLKDRGDMNTSLNFDREHCVSLYEFKVGSTNSTAALPCATSEPVRFGRQVTVNANENYVVLPASDWDRSTTRAQSVVEDAYVELQFTPVAGKRVTLKQLCVDLARNESSVMRTVDVRFDEDPGALGDNFSTVLSSETLPDELGNARAFRRFCFDLDVPQLTDLTKPTRIRLYFWGVSRVLTQSESFLSGLCLGGTGECIKAELQVLGPGNCTPFVSLSMDRPPAYGTTPILTVSGNIPDAPIFLVFTVGCGDGTTRLFGSPCRVWLDVSQTIRLLTKTKLDATGRVDIPLPISQAYASAVGIDFAMQAVLWAAIGDGLSNGLCMSVGCQ